MTRIAHLSDLHILEEEIRGRRGQARFRVNYLSLRRPLDFEDRRERALVALRAAKAAGFDHLLVTGDLTEDGQLEQYAAVREILEDSGIEPERVTLLPGNHDAYGPGWREALAGPLDRWAARGVPGAVTRLPGVTIVSGSTAVPQSFLKSSGRIDDDQLRVVAEAAAKVPHGEALVLAQHHPPYKVMYHWAHGLLNHEDVWALLRAHPHLHVLHGHIHRRRERGLTKDGPPRIFSPTAVADSASPLRLYEVVGGELAAVDLHPEVAPDLPDAGLSELVQIVEDELEERPVRVA